MSKFERILGHVMLYGFTGILSVAALAWAAWSWVYVVRLISNPCTCICEKAQP